MAEDEHTGPGLVKVLLNASILVAAAVLSDPEMRKNAAWAVRWNLERLKAWIDPPEREPSRSEIEAVLIEAERIAGKE